MNLSNYATLDQAKKMKELGYPQDKTDCVWIRNGNNWGLISRELLYDKNNPEKGFIPVGILHAQTCCVDEWYAAPNAQEIELQKQYMMDCSGVFRLNSVLNRRFFGQTHHAQARADAKIWELENSK